MEFYDVIEKRHSVRAFSDKKIEKEKLSKILAAAMKAPSAGNLQAYKIYAVKSAETKEALVGACMYQEFIAQAPVVLVFCSDIKQSEQKYGQRGAELYAPQDATIAAAYAQLAVAAEGLSSVWVGGFDPLEVSRIMDIPSFEVPVAVLPVGYAAEEPYITERRDAKEIIKEV